MRAINASLLLICLTVTGCGATGDFTDNIPLYGKWTDETRLISLQINGAAVDRERYRRNISLPHDSQKEFCGEPYLRGKEETRETFMKGISTNCDITNFEKDEDSLKVHASCTLPQNGDVDVTGSIEIMSKVATEKVDGNVTIGIFAKLPSGTGAAVTAEYKRVLTRLGDC